MAILLFGNQNLMIKKQLKKIVNDIFQGEEANTIEFNGYENSLDEVRNECEQLSLICDKKVVIVKDAYYLSSEKPTKKILVDNNETNIIKYLDNENELTTLIFILNSSKINQKSNIFKKIKEKGKIYELKDVSKEEWPLFVKKYFESRKISIEQKAIDEIVLRSQNDLNIFNNEVNKLILYKMNDIKYEDVDKIFTKPLEDNAFEFVNALLSDDKEKAYKIYKELRITSGIEPVILMNLITSQLIFYDLVYSLDKENYSESKIASKLDSHPYRVKMTLRNLRSVDGLKIKKALNDLFILDKKIKHNEVDRFYNFELFILNF